ncbi:MAG: hypothetical protein U9R53_01735 [Chloroflexota bacterium]|nr:hypothetical protein [Chloroflexota bacterium]
MNENTQERKIPPSFAEKRGAWFILTGLILGVILGVIYSWWINPVVLENTHPASLETSDKDIYRSTIARVYAATGNLDRAYRRLELINDGDPIFTLGAQAQQALAAGDGDQAYALALLASALQSSQSSPQIPTATLQIVPTQTLPISTQTP